MSKVSQLDFDRLRQYYGDKLYEIDKETGNMLSALPKGDIIWILGNIVLQETPTFKLSAINKQNSEIFWTNNHGFYINEGEEPIDIGKDNLLVGFVKGICVLNLQSGEYSWCRPEVDISNIAIDNQSKLGYAMREDLCS